MVTIVDPTVVGLGRYIPPIERIAGQVPELNIIVATGVHTYDSVPFFEHRGPTLNEALGTKVTRWLTCCQGHHRRDRRTAVYGARTAGSGGRDSFAGRADLRHHYGHRLASRTPSPACQGRAPASRPALQPRPRPRAPRSSLAPRRRASRPRLAPRAPATLACPRRRPPSFQLKVASGGGRSGRLASGTQD